MTKYRPPKKITVPALLERKGSTRKIAALTAYDYLTAHLLDQAGVDLILVGDSVATTFQGQATTLPVTLDEMVYHCCCVSRAAVSALVVGDLPFMSYQVSPEQALVSAGRLVKEGGVAAVKLEGGLPMEETIRRITAVDIPVLGHVGLTPQSYHRMGGYKKQGLVADEAGLPPGSRERVLADAQAVERAGAFGVVIEGVPEDLAAEITATVSIPTIGIAAGPMCDGQILVSTDMLGMDPDFRPAFVKRYADLVQVITEAAGAYVADVRGGRYPEQKSKPKTLSAA